MKRSLFYWTLFLFITISFIHGEESEDRKSLFDKTIKKDIDTSDYYDLVSWCQTLGLDSGGQISQLRSSLYKFYNVDTRTGNSVTPEKKSGTVISIKSAKETEYFTIDEIEESMVQFTGDVLLEISEQETSRKHAIQADKVIFNEQKKTITAIGNIKYTLDNAGDLETFWGDSLTFSVDNWKGIIFRGETQRVEEIDGTDVVFYFGGDKISRSGKSVIVLDRGKVSTGDLKNPDFSIKATKIWVTGPMEWGILNGILYMGNVPIFYIPFYFKPGNDLVFNPAIGFNDERGAFLQTTTYFIGQKNYSQSFSFFQVGNEDGEAYETELVGLYKYKIKKKTKENSSYLKMMADVYTNYGGFAALEGQFDEAWEFKDLSFFGGIGMSMDQDSYFYPEMSGPNISPEFHQSYFFGNYIPVRWGTNLSFNIKDLIFKFGWYSDPYFNTDFMKEGLRDENFDWLNMILTDLTSDEDEESLRDLSSYEWRLEYQGLKSSKIPLDGVSPFIQSLTFSKLETSVLFNYTSNSSVYDSTDPARYFSFPSQIIFPNIGFQMKGTLLQLPYIPSKKVSKKKNKGTSETPDEMIDFSENEQVSGEEQPSESTGKKIPQEEISPPWGSMNKMDDKGTKISNGIMVSDLKDDKQTKDITPFSLDIGYTLTPSFLMQVDNALNRYNNPEEIDLRMDPFLIKLTGEFSLNTNMTFLDDIFRIENYNILNAAYSTHRDVMSSGVLVDDSTYISDYSNTDFTWTNDVSVQIKPLKFFDAFSSSYIAYDLKSTLYKIDYAGLTPYYDGGSLEMDVLRPVFNQQWGGWNNNDITKHDATFFVRFNPEYFNIQSKLKVYLPPQDMRETLDSSLNLDIGPWKTQISNSMVHLHEPASGELQWDFGNITMGTSLAFFNDKLKFSQSAVFSTEELVFTSLESNLYAWGFQCKYTMAHTERVFWDKGAGDYTTSLDKALLPKSLYFAFNLAEVSTPLFWKNRMYISGSLNTSWSIDLLRPSNNVLRFGFSLKFHIFKFLDLEFSVSSINRYMYLYFDGWRRDYFGLTGEYDNFFMDLIKSFNFFNTQDRLNSHFNLERFDLSLVHHLRDWDFKLSWTGEMKEIDRNWELIHSLSIGITLNPIPKINTKVLREYNSSNKDYSWSIDAGDE